MKRLFGFGGDGPGATGRRRIVVDDVEVEVVRKSVRRINLRVTGEGRVCLSVPKWGATMREAEAFLRSKLDWIRKTRAKLLARPAEARQPVGEADLAALAGLLGELNALWAERLGEDGVTWRIRRVKTFWGSCNWRKRLLTYNETLARVPRELVEYVVVHEFTHFQAHNHGERFYALMDARLPGWKVLRRRLNRLDGAR